MRRLSEEIVKLDKKEKIYNRKSNNSERIRGVIKKIKKEIQRISEQNERHVAYIEALKNQHVLCRVSEFGLDQITCHSCGEKYIRPKEKQTDVKIALRIISDAYENKFDSLMLISEDSDFFPIINSIITEHNKEVFVAVELSVKKRFKAKIKRQEKFLYEKITIVPISEEMLRQCQLPDVIPIGEGKEIHRPEKYRKRAPAYAS